MMIIFNLRYRLVTTERSNAMIFLFPVFVASRFRRGEERLVIMRSLIAREKAVKLSSETTAANPRDKPAYFARRRVESSTYYASARLS